MPLFVIKSLSQRMSASVAALFLGMVVLTGCAGYHIGPAAPKFMTGIHTIAVPSFRNDTLTPQLEVIAADSVIKQLQLDGTYKITTSNDADAILEGKVTQMRRRGERSAKSDVLTQVEYSLTVTFTYKLTKRSTNEVIDTGTVEGTTSFFVSGNDVNQDERQAIPLALEDACNKLATRLTEGW